MANDKAEQRAEAKGIPEHEGHRVTAETRLETLESDMALLKEWMPQLFTKKPAKIPVRTWLDEEKPKYKTA